MEDTRREQARAMLRELASALEAQLDSSDPEIAEETALDIERLAHLVEAVVLLSQSRGDVLLTLAYQTVFTVAQAAHERVAAMADGDDTTIPDAVISSYAETAISETAKRYRVLHAVTSAVRILREIVKPEEDMAGVAMVLRQTRLDLADVDPRFLQLDLDIIFGEVVRAVRSPDRGRNAYSACKAAGALTAHCNALNETSAESATGNFDGARRRYLTGRRWQEDVRAREPTEVDPTRDRVRRIVPRSK